MMTNTRQLLYAASVIAVTAGMGAQTDPVSLFGAGTISKPDTYESFGSLSPDGREFYYTTHRPDFGQHHIVVSRLAGNRWSAPETLPFSGTWNDREPKLSPDGLRLYFSSTRPLEAGQAARRLDLY